MREWNEFVRTNLRSTSEDEVDEIAGHLEDIYLAELVRGAQLPEAENAAVSEVRDWRRLRRQIIAAKESDVTDRIRKVWFPGLVCLATAAVLEQVLYTIGIWPRIVPFGQYGRFPVNGILLLLLVLCGSVGAYLSRRAGASVGQRVWAALFPASAMALLFTGGMLLSRLLGVFVRRAYTPTNVLAQSYAGYMLGFVVIPGLALLLGALPFLRSMKGDQKVAA